VILIYSDITATKNIEILKRDFFINASHELKSPLTTIIGSAELISRKIVVDQETIMDLIKRITSEANRMNNLVMDMLSLSEYETKYQNKNKIIINLEKIVNDVVNNLAFLSSEKDINITSNVEKSNILMSYEELYQLIKNLVENAIKYGKTKGNVWIEMYYEQSDLVLSVKDDGIGIPQKDLNRIFERFYRVDKARSKSTGGTGLGLSIVKHIVLNYNGHIDISSEEGEGTEIKIFLPKVEIETITG
jgi:two-component system phosphate regulon sensor histidine kinase PhoR